MTVALQYHQVRIISSTYRKTFEYFPLHHMEPVVVLLHPDLGEHPFDELLVGLGTTFARLFFLPAIVIRSGSLAR